MGIFKRKTIDFEKTVSEMQRRDPYPRCRWCGVNFKIVTNYTDETVYYEKACRCTEEAKIGDLLLMEKRIIEAITNPPRGSKKDV